MESTQNVEAAHDLSIFQNEKLRKMVCNTILPLVIVAFVALVYMLSITEAEDSETLKYDQKLCRVKTFLDTSSALFA